MFFSQFAAIKEHGCFIEWESKKKWEGLLADWSPLISNQAIFC